VYKWNEGDEYLGNIPGLLMEIALVGRCGVVFEGDKRIMMDSHIWMQTACVLPKGHSGRHITCSIGLKDVKCGPHCSQGDEMIINMGDEP
jgi:hypothetical protein